MENVVLVIHLILALCLIGVVLLQRSEGGGLGMGGGGVMSGRQAATALSKLTWVFAVAFLITSLSLTIIAARNAAGTSVVDGISAAAPKAEEPAPLPSTDDLLAPPATEEPAVPPKAD